MFRKHYVLYIVACLEIYIKVGYSFLPYLIKVHYLLIKRGTVMKDSTREIVYIIGFVMSMVCYVTSVTYSFNDISNLVHEYADIITVVLLLFVFSIFMKGLINILKDLFVTIEKKEEVIEELLQERNVMNEKLNDLI
jgi:hypothetical protein